MFSPSNFLIFQIVPPLFSPILFSPCRQVRQLVWCTILEMPMWVKSKSRWPFFLPDHISFCLVYDQNPKEASLSKAFGFSHPSSSSSSCLSCSSYSPDSRILCEASRLVSYAPFIPSVTFVSLLLLSYSPLFKAMESAFLYFVSSKFYSKSSCKCSSSMETFYDVAWYREEGRVLQFTILSSWEIVMRDICVR